MKKITIYENNYPISLEYIFVYICVQKIKSGTEKDILWELLERK
jgi:hypothetical protein